MPARRTVVPTDSTPTLAEWRAFCALHGIERMPGGTGSYRHGDVLIAFGTGDMPQQADVIRFGSPWDDAACEVDRLADLARARWCREDEALAEAA